MTAYPLKKQITVDEIKLMGFELIKQYDHDQFHTDRYKKGILEVEFTYENSEIESVTLTMDEINSININTSDLEQLDRILNQEQ